MEELKAGDIVVCINKDYNFTKRDHIWQIPTNNSMPNHEICNRYGSGIIEKCNVRLATLEEREWYLANPESHKDISCMPKRSVVETYPMY